MTKILEEVLLIDDSNADNFLHKRVIKRSGLVNRVSVARDGAAGIAYLKSAERRPDMVFLDINMPIMDGWEFLEAFKLLEQHFQPPVVVTMLSTSVNPLDRAKAKSNAFRVGYISKPLTVELLQAIIEEHFPSDTP